MSRSGGSRNVTTPDHSTAHVDGEYCPYFQHTVELLGRRWTGAILRVLMISPHRFGEIRAAVPGLSDRLLAERLHELEGEGLVERSASDECAIYSLSDRGHQLEPVFVEIERYVRRCSTGACAPERPGRIRST